MNFQPIPEAAKVREQIQTVERSIVSRAVYDRLAFSAYFVAREALWKAVQDSTGNATANPLRIELIAVTGGLGEQP